MKVKLIYLKAGDLNQKHFHQGQVILIEKD